MKKKGLLKKIGIAIVALIVIAAIAGSCGKKRSSNSSSTNGSNTEQSSSAQPEKNESSSAPKEEAKKEEPKAESSSQAEETPKGEEQVDETTVRPEFKEAMDSYEAFFDEYVEFMNQYKNDPTNAELLAQYSDMLSKEAKMLKEFDDMKNDDSMTTAETAYYLEVHSRIMDKLAKVV